MKRIMIGAIMLLGAYQSAAADIISGGINYLRYKDAGVAKPDTSNQDPNYYKNYANQISSQYGASKYIPAGY